MGTRDADLIATQKNITHACWKAVHAPFREIVVREPHRDGSLPNGAVAENDDFILWRGFHVDAHLGKLSSAEGEGAREEWHRSGTFRRVGLLLLKRRSRAFSVGGLHTLGSAVRLTWSCSGSSSESDDMPYSPR